MLIPDRKNVLVADEAQWRALQISVHDHLEIARFTHASFKSLGLL